MDAEVRRSDTARHDIFGDGKIIEDAKEGAPGLHVRPLGASTAADTTRSSGSKSISRAEKVKAAKEHKKSRKPTPQPQPQNGDDLLIKSKSKDSTEEVSLKTKSDRTTIQKVRR